MPVVVPAIWAAGGRVLEGRLVGELLAVLLEIAR